MRKVIYFELLLFSIYFNFRLISPHFSATIFSENGNDRRGPTLLLGGPPLEKTVV